MKALLSVLLGLMLLTSLVGISYATPIVQPTQNTGGNNNACLQQPPNSPNQNYSSGVDCHAHSGGGNGNDPKGCISSIPSSGLEVSDNHGVQPLATCQR